MRALCAYLQQPTYGSLLVEWAKESFLAAMLDQELSWTDFQAAFHVGRLGTVSAAADYLGVHRATIQRHIDALERQLGAKLFHRHTRGYTLTEIGHAMMEVAASTQDQFNQIAGLAQKRDSELTGEFVVTSIDFVLPRLMPILKLMVERHPKIELNYVSSAKLLRMEYGEAHVALRIGAKPEEPDSIVQFFAEVECGLFASKEYAQRFGVPQSLDEVTDHKFFRYLGHAESHPWHVWSHRYIPDDSISLKSHSPTAIEKALYMGLGIGLHPIGEPAVARNLVPVLPQLGTFSEVIWLVTHVDVHRTPKVQAFIELLKEEGYLPPPEHANSKKATAPL